MSSHDSDSRLAPHPSTHHAGTTHVRSGDEILAIPRFSLIVLMGATSSGKSSFARHWFPASSIVSAERCRYMVAGDENAEWASAEAFALLETWVTARLKLGQLTVVDASGLEPRFRLRMLDLAREFHAPAILIALDLSVQTCLDNDKGRVRGPATDNIERQVQRLARALSKVREEGWNRVIRMRESELKRTRLEIRPLRVDCIVPPPYDLIGDVHGCFGELTELLTKLGYRRDERAGFRHPQGRRVVFVGDLIDRGPASLKVIQLAMQMHKAGTALMTPGNHDDKLLRYLGGGRVRLDHGFEKTVAELEALPPDERGRFLDELVPWLKGLPPYLMLDDGKLVVAHAGLPEHLQGRLSRAVMAWALFGEARNYRPAPGQPERVEWPVTYQGKALVIYGHTPSGEARRRGNTLCIDQGCVFGGKLTAYRYPEGEMVQVKAQETWYPNDAPDLDGFTSPEPEASAPQPAAAESGAAPERTESTDEVIEQVDDGTLQAWMGDSAEAATAEAGASQLTGATARAGHAQAPGPAHVSGAPSGHRAASPLLTAGGVANVSASSVSVSSVSVSSISVSSVSVSSVSVSSVTVSGSAGAGGATSTVSSATVSSSTLTMPGGSAAHHPASGAAVASVTTATVSRTEVSRSEVSRSEVSRSEVSRSEVSVSSITVSGGIPASAAGASVQARSGASIPGSPAAEAPFGSVSSEPKVGGRDRHDEKGRSDDDAQREKPAVRDGQGLPASVNLGAQPDLPRLLTGQGLKTRWTDPWTPRSQDVSAALELLAESSVDPRWLIYIPPSVAVANASQRAGLLEHPAEVLQMYRSAGLPIAFEEMQIGVRGVFIIGADDDACEAHLGIRAPGMVYDGQGRAFFDGRLQGPVISMVQQALVQGGVFERLDARLLVFEALVQPWSLKRQEFLARLSLPAANALFGSRGRALEALELAMQRRLPVKQLRDSAARDREAAIQAQKSLQSCSWPVKGVEAVKIAPLQLLATEKRTFWLEDRRFQAQELDAWVKTSPQFIPTRRVFVTGYEQERQVYDLWESLQQSRGGGMVARTMDPMPRHGGRLEVPAMKVRSRDFLRVVYGPQYLNPDMLQWLRERPVRQLRAASAREWALAAEGLELFTRGGGFASYHPYVLAVLASQQEVTDPRR